MSSAYGNISPPQSLLSSICNNISSILPLTFHLKNTNEKVQVLQVDKTNIPLISHIRDMLNKEIREGISYPQDVELTPEEFNQYFLGGECFWVKRKSKDISSKANDIENQNTIRANPDYSKEVMGVFYIKPNYPGRCNHVRKTKKKTGHIFF